MKISKIYKYIIILLTVLLTGYPLLLPFEISSSLLQTTVMIVIVCLFVYIRFCLNTKTNPRIRHCFRWLDKYILIYISIVLFAMVYSWIIYEYGPKTIIYSYATYFYILLAYALVYVFICDKSIEPFIHRVSSILMLILSIKALCWFLYNFFGVEIFPNLLFEYNVEGHIWNRGGIQRVFSGYLIGIVLAYHFNRFVNTNKKILHGVIVLFIIGFTYFITASRFQFLTCIASCIVGYIFSGKGSIKVIRRTIIIVGIIFVITSDAFLNFVSSFSLTSSTGGSTLARLNTFYHYMEIMVEKKSIFGLGVLSTYNDKSYSLLRIMGSDIIYYIEDLGIIGGFIRFGVLAVIIYFPIYYSSVKTCLNLIKSGNRDVFIYVMCAYLVISCLVMNIFDIQRAFDVPFYCAVICFYRNKERGTLLELL